MNTKQRIVSWVFLGLFGITVLFAPWQVSRMSNGHVYQAWYVYQPIFASPSYEDRQSIELRYGPLFVTWLALGIAHSAMFFLFKKPKTA